ncbi:MAG: DegT/DnrJ/EryC1/StrS family aminotransferase [Limnohabitans sp.]|nr:DegT/DnrJ/EryC1/StrS family aminotransferase [Limnohabitans sp.]
MTATAAAVNVPLLDLKAQYATIRDEIEPVIKEVLESQYFIGGPKIGELECMTAGYCQTKFAVGCANGSDAILLALQALGIGAGDAVVCPTFTFFATAGSVHRLGAQPVFVDVDPATYNICPESTRQAFRCHKNIKAIVPVHLFGQAADLDAMLAIGHEFGVPVIEDAAQAIGTEDPQGRRVGSRGAIGTFSYFPSKNLGGFGDGGIITTNDEALATRMMRLRNHGMEPKYYHDEVGMNSRLDALQAAILLVKMRHLDAWSSGRQKNAAFYDHAFATAGATDSGTPLSAGGFQLRTPKAAPKGARHIYNQYTIRVPAAIRDAVRQDLAERKIGTEIYYPVPLHLQKCFAHLHYSRGIFPHAELAALEAIALPIYPDLVPAQLEHVAASVIECVRNRMSR